MAVATGNPILGADRDPKVFWYEPGKMWVMVFYNINFIEIYNSKDLKNWVHKSNVNGFYECPELFELAVDGSASNKKWVLTGASGTYLIGSFDGARFTPEAGKYYYNWGSQYAAQTYNNTPDGRRIQIGWGRIDQPEMPFNHQMLFPNELSLRTTREGIRLFCNPIAEIEKLHDKKHYWKNIATSQLNAALRNIKSDLLHVKLDIEMDSAVGFEIHYRGDPIIYYDGNYNQMNHAPYVGPKPANYRFNIEFLLDKNSVEAYIDQGKLFISEALTGKKISSPLEIIGSVKIYTMELFELKSIWK